MDITSKRKLQIPCNIFSDTKSRFFRSKLHIKDIIFTAALAIIILSIFERKVSPFFRFLYFPFIEMIKKFSMIY